MTGEPRKADLPFAARVANILLVEDNPGDIELARDALTGAGQNYLLHVAEDGIEAISFLRKTDGYERSPRPDIILLDLNLPRKGGLEVLTEMKGDRDLKSIPVVVFTSSQYHQDISRAYALQANCYIVKPIDLKDYLAVMMTIEKFWLETVLLPD